jgi:hypothetical protein
MFGGYEWDSYDEGGYCEACDNSFYDDMPVVHLDQWNIRYACPLCGDVHPKVFRSDEYYDLGYYLLSVADDEFVFPDFVTPLPKYEA